MCLNSVSTTIRNPTSLVQSGWKVFGGSKDKPTFQHMPLASGRTVPLDKWIKAEGNGIADGSISYHSGFHIYENETQIKNYDKRRVYFRRAHTIGWQDNATVIVATEMYVPSDPDAWPPKD